MGEERDLYNAVHVQYSRRLEGLPYLSPEQIGRGFPERSRFAFDAAEVAELMFQMPRIGWNDYVDHARVLVKHPEKVYDFVKFLRKGTTGKIAPVGCLEAAAEE